MAAHDEYEERLVDLEAAASANLERSRAILERAAMIRTELARGAAVGDAIQSEPPPLIVELITENIEALNIIGSAFRSAQASALRAEGWTMQEIADLFGVTRQRVSALLRQN